MFAGICGDLHLKENLSYDEYVKGGRNEEKEEILDFIVKTFSPCDTIFFLGDLLNGRSNTPGVIRSLVNFIERFNGKEIYIIAGNHEKFGDGRSSLDFLAEIKNPQWHIITKDIPTLICDKGLSITFLPSIFKGERGSEDNMEFVSGILKELPGGDILFHHFAMTGSKTNSDINVEIFNEPIFPRTTLESKYKLVVGGHIHLPSAAGRTIVTGSIFNNEVGETQKYIWTIDDNLKVDQIKLPGRAIYKLENPTKAQLDKIPDNSIVKAVITQKLAQSKVEELRERLSKFDAFLISEQIPRERKKIEYGNGEAVTEFSIEQLLEVYAKERDIDLTKLKLGFELIK